MYSRTFDQKETSNVTLAGGDARKQMASSYSLCLMRYTVNNSVAVGKGGDERQWLNLADNLTQVIWCRTSQLLGEAPGKQAQRNAAAEISRASMQLARTEAKALSRPGSELEILEQQQCRLREMRQARQAAWQAAQSTQKPGKRAVHGQPAGMKHILRLIQKALQVLDALPSSSGLISNMMHHVMAGVKHAEGHSKICMTVLPWE